MKSLSRLFATLSLVGMLTGANAAAAQTLSRADIINHLMAYNTPVDTITIRKTLPNPSEFLCDIAEDRSVNGYARQRASAALTEMGDEIAFQCLKRLATDRAVEPVLRRYALYAFGRRYGAERPAIVLPILEKALQSSDIEDREKAIRALAYSPSAQALPVLQRIVRTERNKELVNLAKSRLDNLAIVNK